MIKILRNKHRHDENKPALQIYVIIIIIDNNSQKEV